MTSPALEQASLELLEKYRIAVENVTQKQLASALVQAIACGDFMRHVRIDTYAQAVTYIPYREEDNLRRRIRELEQRLEKLGVSVDQSCDY